MKKIFLALFLFVPFMVFCQKENDSLMVKRNYNQSTLLRGTVVDLGTAYIPSNSAMTNPNLFQVKTGRPSTVNIYFFRPIHLFSKYLAFAPGIGVGLDSYFFEKNLQIAPSGSSVFSINNTLGITKSKLSASYVDIPLEIHFSSSPNYKRAFRIAVGGKIGVLFASKSKIKYPDQGVQVKVKYSDISVNRFRYGLTARIGYGILNFFAYYSLSSLFRNQYAPTTNPVIFGISLTTF